MAPIAHPPLTPFGSALAGALGSVFANAAVYPLDTVKTRLQAIDEDEDEENENESLPLTKDSTKSKRQDKRVSTIKGYLKARLKKWGMLMLLMRILRTEGLSGAFHGFGASMIGTFSQQFAYFFFHTLLRTSYLRRIQARSLTTNTKSNNSITSISTSIELLLGAAAGALAQIFTIPVQVIATRQQLWQPDSLSKNTNSNAPSLIETAQEIISENGLTGLWTGLKPGLVLTVNPAITYGTFERLKSYQLSKRGSININNNHNNGKLGVAESFWLGVLSKMLATVVTYPYIFAKVRLQAKATPEELRYDAEHPSKGKRQDTSNSASNSGLQLETTTDTEAASEHMESVENDQKQEEDTAAAGVTPSYASVASVPPPSFGSATIELPKSDSEKIKISRPELKNKQSHKYHHHHKHALSLLKSVYKEHGIKGWYKGLGAQILKAVLCQGILFVSKDQFESYSWLLLVLFNNFKKKLTLNN
ncbi:uncharacterized protein L201_001615 [Kwoniella dendrophila CBS 6074]|uniref:Adenine nucleotide transporter n=1 Tax=Kwoniella dendrophila CBS 6074 TaxID=1295534 RepID=A0AAX4JMT2_9TREE